MTRRRQFLTLIAAAGITAATVISVAPSSGAAAPGSAAIVLAACTNPTWAEGQTYQAGTRVTYQSRTYQALVTHTAYPGTGWNPAATPTLWQDLGACTGGGGPTPPPPPSGTVYFQDTGTVQGWSNYPQNPQKQGVIRNVSSPVYKGTTAIEARQTYINETGGYHSETVQEGVQVVGQDKYYGQAVYLPPNWQYHNQNVTFQQWSPENPSGPWELMYVINDEIRLGGSGGISGVIGKIQRGVWTRIVVRLKFASGTGAFEVWLNGVKTFSRTNQTVLPKTSNSIRWSSGIYCTAWRDGTPAGQSVLSVFHDHARIASSYALAEPANW